MKKFCAHWMTSIILTSFLSISLNAQNISKEKVYEGKNFKICFAYNSRYELTDFEPTKGTQNELRLESKNITITVRTDTTSLTVKQLFDEGKDLFFNGDGSLISEGIDVTKNKIQIYWRSCNRTDLEDDEYSLYQIFKYIVFHDRYYIYFAQCHPKYKEEATKIINSFSF